MLDRLFVLILTAVAIYLLISAIIVMKGLQTITSRYKSKEATDDFQPNFGALRARCTNFRQILGATFFLFGFVFFIGLQNAPITIGDGPQLPILEVLNNFAFDFTFAANVFLIFLVLHLVQWLLSNRLQAGTQRLGGLIQL